jgi:cytochrome d ubiquinol oxidase subunit I
MNSPSGFDFVDGKYTNIDPMAAMFNDAWLFQSLHMTLAAIAATGFAVAGVHAIMILKKQNIHFHTRAFKIAASFGMIAALLQPISGDLSAKDIAKRQPAKLAAMEAHFHTTTKAPLIIGGIPDEANEKVHYAVELPGMLSFLAHGDFEKEVAGLDQVAKQNRPPVVVTHFAFQIMVGIGVFMMVLAVLFFLSYRKKQWLQSRWFMMLFAAATPLGFIAVEAGWTVTALDYSQCDAYCRRRYPDAWNCILVLPLFSYLCFPHHRRNLFTQPSNQNGPASV